MKRIEKRKRDVSNQWDADAKTQRALLPVVKHPSRGLGRVFVKGCTPRSVLPRVGGEVKWPLCLFHRKKAATDQLVSGGDDGLVLGLALPYPAQR